MVREDRQLAMSYPQVSHICHGIDKHLSNKPDDTDNFQVGALGLT